MPPKGSQLWPRPDEDVPSLSPGNQRADAGGVLLHQRGALRIGTVEPQPEHPLAGQRDGQRQQAGGERQERRTRAVDPRAERREHEPAEGERPQAARRAHPAQPAESDQEAALAAAAAATAPRIPQKRIRSQGVTIAPTLAPSTLMP